MLVCKFVHYSSETTLRIQTLLYEASSYGLTLSYGFLGGYELNSSDGFYTVCMYLQFVTEEALTRN